MEQRPWGYFENLHTGKDYLVKKIVIYPGKRFSLQRHKKRDEHWVVVQGTGNVMQSSNAGFMDEYDLEVGSAVYISKNQLHRLHNTSETEDFIIIEVQQGVCDENDIERLEDDFGRGESAEPK